MGSVSRFQFDCNMCDYGDIVDFDPGSSVDEDPIWYCRFPLGALRSALNEVRCLY